MTKNTRGMGTYQIHSDYSRKLFVRWSVIAVISRLIPHPPGMTAITSLCLLSGQLQKSYATLFVLITAFASDLLLYLMLKSPWLGAWVLFTYSGYLLLSLFGALFRCLSLFSMLILGALLYWFWTNLGVWLLSGLYTHSLQGFITCYELALPFLLNNMIGNVLWGTLLIVTFKLPQLARTQNFANVI